MSAAAEGDCCECGQLPAQLCQANHGRERWSFAEGEDAVPSGSRVVDARGRRAGGLPDFGCF
eukprot:306717-Pyramimonas_sp.AAC.1